MMTTDTDPRYGRKRGVQGQPYQLTAGMAVGTKVRGNAAVKRAAKKVRNKK